MYKMKMEENKHNEFKKYLERKINREPYPLKNIVYDVIAKFEKDFEKELNKKSMKENGRYNKRSNNK